MITRWGANIEKDKVLLEYPRPQMRRNSYINLNGMWQYAIVRGESLPDKIDGEILVPFSPECELSGVHRTVGPEDTLWYVKNFSLPADFNIGRVLLHFGAVDQIAEVYLNGIEVGSHTGGYTPFSIDITRELREENQLIVKVRDVTDTSWHTRGKQKIRKGGIWYTPQSGIWQTVWMESVPEEYISGLHILPLYDEAAVEITVYSDVERPCTARMGLVVAQGETNRPFRMSVQGFTPWSPENPHLYGFSVKMGEDMVESYFGMRKVELREDENGIKRLFLNDKPYFHNGVLDQGYWPEGLLTAPAPESYADDILAMKRLGFNTLRKHIKVEPEEFYYQCDRLGMIVWQDMVNNGSYRYFRDTVLPTVGIQKRNDRRLHRDERSRNAFRQGAADAVNQLKNHPCICYWTIFNEGWGQFDSDRVCGWFRTLDATRFIDTTSGWFRGKNTDVDSRHQYFGKLRLKGDGLRPLVLSEFGGKTWRVEGHIFNPDKTYGYGACPTREALNEAVAALYRESIVPAVEKGLRKCCLTGVLAGYPVVFLKATLTDGSYHPVDSSDIAFQLAAGLAFKEALPEAKPVLMEPIGELKVTVPDSFVGDVMGDLNKRRGRVMGMNPTGDGETVLEAEVPMAEMMSYAIDLRSMTQSRGTFVFSFVRYEDCPAAAQEKAIAEAKAMAEAE